MVLPAIYDVDISKRLLPTPLQHMLITKDKGANRIAVRLFNGHVPYFPQGTCFGFAVRKDGVTVPIRNGVIDGNIMYIDLTADVYAIDGPVNIGVKNVDGSSETTVFLGLGVVSLGETDVAIDPGHEYTVSIARLDAHISTLETQAIQAVQSVNDAVDRAEQIASNLGYIGMYIDENGHLIYVRTSNVENIDFELVDGRLIAIWPET